MALSKYNEDLNEVMEERRAMMERGSIYNAAEQAYENDRTAQTEWENRYRTAPVGKPHFLN